MQVLIADDHEIFRTGIKAMLSSLENVQVVAETSSGEETIAWLKAHSVDVVLLDQNMQGGSGIDVLRLALADPAIDAKFILLTGVRSALVFDEAISLGAAAVISKRGRGDELLGAIEAAMNHHDMFVSEEVQNIMNASNAFSELTNREKSVLMLLLEGKALSTIADELHIAFKTAETHKTRMMSKLELHSTPEIIAFAHEHGLFLGSG